MYCENCGKEIAKEKGKIIEGVFLCEKCANDIISRFMEVSEAREINGCKRTGRNFENTSPTDEDTYILSANMWNCSILIEKIGRIVCGAVIVIGIIITLLLAFTVSKTENLSLLGINISGINSESIAVIIILLSGIVSTAIWAAVSYLSLHILSLILGGRASIIKSLKATELSSKGTYKN